MKKPFFSAIFFFLSFFAFTEEIKLPHLFTYIDSPIVEQRQVYTSEEIQELKAEDLPSLMEATGIQLLSYGPYGLEQKPGIRGFTDETVRVIIDGICVNNAQYGTFDFSTINVENIERIEIVRGGFTEGVQDEGAVGGAIYITTKKQLLGQQFFSDSSIGSFLNSACPLDTFSQSFGYNRQLGAANFVKTNGKITFANNKYLFKNYKGTISQRNNASVLDGNANLNYLHFFGSGNSFSVNNLFYGGKKNIPGAENSTNPGIQKDYDNNLTFQLINPCVASFVKLENSLAWLSNTRFYQSEANRNSGQAGSKHYVNSAKYSLSGKFYKYEWLKENFGLTFDYTNLNSTDDGKHNQFSGALKNTIGYEKKFFSATLPLAFKFTNQNFAFIPKLGTGLKLSHVDFLLDGYKMVQFPNMDDLYWDDGLNKGNPDLKPEDGWGGDFTINVHQVWMPFSICVFTNYYENKIQWAPINGNPMAWTPQNVAKAFYLGCDFSFEKSFWNNRIEIKGNGEYLYNRLLGKNNTSTYGKRIMLTPDFTGSVSATLKLPATQKLPEFTCILNANYVGKRYTQNININYLEPYVLVNFAGETKFIKNSVEIIPYFKIENLLDSQYQSVENYPMPGISVSVGLKIKG